MLLGREAECEQIDALLQEARDGVSGVLVIRGEPGIGKTALLDYAEGRAGAARTLRARGVEAESELPFAGLSQLLRPILDHMDALPPPQQAALSGALGLAAPLPGDPLAVSVATLGLLAVGAEAGSLVALVDDAHWLDSASLQALVFAARRLRAEAIALVLVVREGVPTPLDSAGLPELQVAGLRTEDARELLRGVAPEMAPEVAEAVLETAAGNPLALTEIPRLLGAEQIAGREPLPDPLPASATLGAAFLRRVEDLPERTAKALLVAAAAGAGEAGAVPDALVELGLEWRDLEPAEAAGLFELDSVRFRHPIVRSSVYHAASARERRQAHAALASAYPANEISLRRARHLGLASDQPDEEVAAALEQAALDARLRGGYDGAARAFERAARLTPDHRRRARRLAEAGHDFQVVGQLQRATTVLEEALACDPERDVLATILHLQGRGGVLSGAPPEGVARMLEAAAVMETEDAATASKILSEVVMASLAMGDARAGLASARRAAELAEGADPGTQLLASLELVQAFLVAGQAVDAERLLDRCLPALHAGGSMAIVPWAFHVPLLTLIYLERFGEARDLIDRAAGAARSGNAPGLLPIVLYPLGELEFRTGNWTRGVLATSEAVQLAEELAQGFSLAYGLALLARFDAVRGRAAECRENASRALALAEAFMTMAVGAFAHAALGRLALGIGETREAVAILEPVARENEERGIAAPAILQWEPDLVEAYVRLGRAQEAEEALERLTSAADGAGRGWTRAVAARCRGLLGSETEFEADFDEALLLHAASPMPFERARTELCLGERLRRAGRRADARRPLRSSLETFERLGAAPWAERARGELKATGDTPRARTPRPLADLTPHEFQVALAVADGATNREAAAALFLSPKTIDFHLRNIFRKLDVRSRSQLAALIARERARV